MEAYKRWVLRNRDYVHSLESLANGLTWLLPDRFSNSEVGPEAVTSILGIFTSVNEHILSISPTGPRTGHMAASSSVPYSLCITLLKDMETLVEVVAQQLYGEDMKWNLISITEAAKVLLRSAALRGSGYKMLLHGGENVNDGTDTNDLNTNRNGSHPHGVSDAVRNNQWTLEGRALSALSKFGENARSISGPTWLRTAQHQQGIFDSPISSKPSLSSFLSNYGIQGGLFLTAEMMHILRPLIYVLLIRRYGSRSWFPWLASLSVDLVGNGLNSYHMFMSQNTSKNEKTELKRRKLLWALYLMRDPFFTKYTRQRLDGAQKLFEPVPVVGFLTEKLVELLVGAQTRYTYMSGS